MNKRRLWGMTAKMATLREIAVTDSAQTGSVARRTRKDVNIIITGWREPVFSSLLDLVRLFLHRSISLSLSAFLQTARILLQSRLECIRALEMNEFEPKWMG
jgi:hypothetical protein